MADLVQKLQLEQASWVDNGKWEVLFLKQKATKTLSDDRIEYYKNSLQESGMSSVGAEEAVYQKMGREYESIGEFDSFISLNGNHQTDIVQNAIEQGSFRSVNKIRKPNTFTIELAKGGNRAKVETLLSNLKRFVGSTDVVRIITPFGFIDNMNIIKMDYSFTADGGSNLLVAKLTLQEILYGNVSEGYTLQKVKVASNTDTSNSGRVAKRSWK